MSDVGSPSSPNVPGFEQFDQWDESGIYSYSITLPETYRAVGVYIEALQNVSGQSTTVSMELNGNNNNEYGWYAPDGTMASGETDVDLADVDDGDELSGWLWIDGKWSASAAVDASGVSGDVATHQAANGWFHGISPLSSIDLDVGVGFDYKGTAWGLP